MITSFSFALANAHEDGNHQKTNTIVGIITIIFVLFLPPSFTTALKRNKHIDIVNTQNTRVFKSPKLIKTNMIKIDCTFI